MKILITGSSGFLGKTLFKYLSSDNQILGLSSRTVNIEDKTYLSEYFNLTEFSPEFFVGKNALVINGSDKLKIGLERIIRILKNKSKYIGPTLNLNVNKDDAELNDFLYCWEQFESRPNKIVIHNTYSTKAFNEALSKHIEERNSFTEFLPTEEDFIINDKMFVKIEDKKIYCSYIVIDRTHENSIINEITFFYADETNFDRIQLIIEELNECLIDFCEDETNKLNTITIGLNGLEIEDLNPYFS